MLVNLITYIRADIILNYNIFSYITKANAVYNSDGHDSSDNIFKLILVNPLMLKLCNL